MNLLDLPSLQSITLGDGSFSLASQIVFQSRRSPLLPLTRRSPIAAFHWFWDLHLLGKPKFLPKTLEPNEGCFSKYTCSLFCVILAKISPNWNNSSPTDGTTFHFTKLLKSIVSLSLLVAEEVDVPNVEQVKFVDSFNNACVTTSESIDIVLIESTRRFALFCFYHYGN